MSRKRRIFELDMPEEPGAGASAPASTPTPEPAPGPETFPAGKVEGEPGRGRRGPMATAVQENAEALRSRAEAEAAIRAENDALAHELVRLKREGLVVDLTGPGSVHLQTRSPQALLDWLIPRLPKPSSSS